MSTKSLKKSRTFFFSNKSSTSTPALVDFSMSHQSVTGREIIHFSHPQHSLLQLSSPYIFTCDGCKEYGAGEQFKCRNCDFDLHDFCALAPPSLQQHPLHTHHQLVFYTKPGNGLLRSRCDICAKATRGYAYRCTKCSFEMHPCCSKFCQEMNLPVHPHTLHLLPFATVSDHNFVCGECKGRRQGRVYGCRVCEYQLHAVCAKGMMNGLHSNGITAPEKPSMLGAAAKIASHVIMGFIGGIVEGIGEGVGEVLVENIGREGKSSSRGRIK